MSKPKADERVALMLDAPYNHDLRHPNVLRCYRQPLEAQREAILNFLGDT